jgi:hypothetical protein
MLTPISMLALVSLVFTPATDKVDPALLSRLSRRCGTEIAWCKTWEQAAKRAAAEHKRVLVLVNAVRLDFPMTVWFGPLMDEDVIEVTRECFVSLLFNELDKGARFASQDAYGIGWATVGTAFLIATENGQIVGETFTQESSSLYDFLAGQVPDTSDPPGLSHLELAARHARRGELGAALDLLDKEDGASAELLRATILRRQRKAEAALAALARAKQLAEIKAADVAVREAVLLTRLDRTGDAMAALAHVPADHADAAQAAYLKGTLLVNQDRHAAEQVWQELVQSHPESRFAWLAASQLETEAIIHGHPAPNDLPPAAWLVASHLATEASLHGHSGTHDWPSADVLAALHRRKPEVLPVSAADHAERSALAFLLAAQRRDGSWICPEEVMNTASTHADPFVIAISALCARALVPFVNEPGVHEAVLRALAFVRAARREPEKPPVVADSTVWSKPCLLLFLASAIEAGIAEPSEWRPVMGELVSELAPKQKPGGGFAYYQSDADAWLVTANNSISFVTAFVLVALAATQDAGVEVPEDMIDRALTCLERMKNPDGTFEYSLGRTGEQGGKEPHTPLPIGSAGRGPLCALALRLFDKADVGDLRRALDQFITHRQSYVKEQGKTLMHCGTEAVGSHYLMFDYAFAASAIALLPAAERSQYRTAMLDQVLAARSEAGSYIDNPILGDHYGTGMALWVFEQLREKP